MKPAVTIVFPLESLLMFQICVCIVRTLSVMLVWKILTSNLLYFILSLHFLLPLYSAVNIKLISCCCFFP